MLVVPGLLLAACTLPALETPTPRATPTAEATATPAATIVPSPSGSPAPGMGAVPAFEAGTSVVTATDGLRVRRAPGIDRSILVQRLPTGARLQIILGPIPVDDLGWYLASDADDAEPVFGEGWIAAGFDPEPFLAPSDTPAEADPYPASFAYAGSAEFGPISIDDERYALRWVAIDPERSGCTFAVDLRAGSDAAVPAIRAPIGNAPTPGMLGSDYFVDQSSLRGQVFMTVATSCAWAITFVRLPPPG